jgi:hypothetical protein
MVDEDLQDASSSFSLEELRDIFSFNASTKCDTHDLIRCSCLHDEKEKADDVEIIEKDPSEERLKKLRKVVSSSDSTKLKDAHSNMKSQVLNMKHFAGSFPDDALLACGDSISFLFQLEIDWRKNDSKKEEIALSDCGKTEEGKGSERNMFELSDSDLCFIPPFEDEDMEVMEEEEGDGDGDE